MLNVAYGVENAFPDLFTYKTVTVLDLPETDITSFFPECVQFINEASQQVCVWKSMQRGLCVCVCVCV